MSEVEVDLSPAADAAHARPAVDAVVASDGESAGGPPPASLTRRVRSGALWSASTTVLLRVGNIAIMAVVARIVTREEFGVFGLAVTAHLMLVALAELGVSAAVARSDLDPDEIAPTVATIAIVGSALLAGVVFLSADVIAGLVGSADAAPPLRVLALSIAMTGPFAVPSSQLQREFRQSRIFLASVVAFVPANLVLIVLALHADGALAFAWSRVVGQLAMGLVMLASLSKHYWPGFRRSVLGPLLRFGVPLALASLLSQVLVNVDYVFVGHLLGTAVTGLYVLAFNIGSWSTSVLGSMLNGVVLPAFSRVKADGGDLPRALARGVRTVALIACPIGALTMALASPLITTVYGDKWADAAPVLSILSLYGVLSVLCLLFANVVMAMGRSGILMWVQAAALVVLAPALYAGISAAGVVGAGLAHIAVIVVVTTPVYLAAVRRSTGAGPVVVVRAIAPPFAAAAAAGVTAWAVALLPPTAFLALAAGGLAGAFVYAVLMTPLLVPLLPGALAGTAPVRLWVAARARAARSTVGRLGWSAA